MKKTLLSIGICLFAIYHIYSQVTTIVNPCSDNSLGSINLEFDADLLIDNPFPWFGEWENINNGDYETFEVNSLSFVIQELNEGNIEISINLIDQCYIYIDENLILYNVGYVILNASESDCNNGVIDITVSGGKPPYDIEWATPSGFYQINSVDGFSGQEDLNNIEDGIYHLTVTDNFCGELTQDFEVLCCGIYIQEPQVYHPTECNGTGGFDFLTGAHGGVYPITGVWTDENGIVIENDGYTKLYGVPSGIYHLTLTDAVGCTKVLTYHLVGQNEPSVVFDIMPACEGGTQGYIYVIAYNEVTNPTYTYTWSTGQVDVETDESEVFGLTAGVHTVTITDDIGTCELVKDFIIPEVGPTLPLSLSSSYEIPCPGEANGSISLNIAGGLLYYHIDWTTDINGSNPQNLEAGTYSVLITDYCGEQISRTFVLESLDATITVYPGCGDGYAEIDINWGTPPYNWSYDNGLTNPLSYIMSPLQTGSHSVTITDDAGCVLVEKFEVQNKEIEVEIENPCHGQNNGTAIVKIYNPLNEPTLILFNGQDITESSGVYTELNLSNLIAGYSYLLEIEIGDCFYNYQLNVEDASLTTSFSKFENNICFYNEVCDGEVVNFNSIQSNVFYDFNDGESGAFKGCFIRKKCKINGQYEEVARLNMDKKWVRAPEYANTLNAVQNAGVFF